MKLMTLTKPARAPLLPSLEEATAAASDLAAQRRALDAEIVGLESALALDATVSAEERQSDRLAVLRERAAPFADMKPRYIRRRLEDARDELEALLPKVFGAIEAKARADRTELRQRAEHLKPQHAAVVERIADALEKLAAAPEPGIRVATAR